jgi:hypothetical protein
LTNILLYRDKNWIQSQRDLGKSFRQIAEEQGVSKYTIQLWYYDGYKEKNRLHNKEFRKNNKEKAKIWDKRKYDKIKLEIISKLGNKCVLCGENRFNFLTVDHVNNDGNKEKHNNHYSIIRQKIINGLTEEELKLTYQVLCYNCNCSKTNRIYMTLSEEKLSYSQKHQKQLWQKAFEFFGPCKTCGDSKLKHLTVSHIHNDGAKKRREGEKHGAELLKVFKKQNWPESLKEDYCLECWNCNCSGNVREL